MSDRPLLVDRRPDRVVATLNRPEKRNAIDQATIDALHALCDELEARPRTLILTGAGGTFAAGADIAQLRERGAEDALRGINATAFIRVRELPMPVIAGGRRIRTRRRRGAGVRGRHPNRIAEHLRIGNPETGLGIIAAAGAAWRLPEIVGRRTGERAAADRSGDRRR